MSGGTSDHSLLTVYPHCTVVCGEPQFLDNRRDVLLNPVRLAEVLSRSSEQYDRGKKFEFYRNVPSLREYLLIHQETRRVEHHSRQVDESWLARDHAGNESVVTIPSLGFHIALVDLYAETTSCN